MKPTWQEILNAMSEESFQEALKKRQEHIKAIKDVENLVLNDVSYRVTEWKEQVYLESMQYGQDDWVQVEDLTELRVWEYNELVDEIHEHFPDYPIERLEGRFV